MRDVLTINQQSPFVDTRQREYVKMISVAGKVPFLNTNLHVGGSKPLNWYASTLVVSMLIHKTVYTIFKNQFCASLIDVLQERPELPYS